MAILSESVTFPIWAVAITAVAVVAVTVLVRRLNAKHQVAVVLGIVLLGVFSIAGPALLHTIANWPDRHDAAAVTDTAVERRALAARLAELSAHATMPGSLLACLGALASEPVQSACERSIFANPTSLAVAVSYAAAQLRLLADGAAFAHRTDSSFAASFAELRLAAENDAYGIYAHVLATRDGCTPERCDAFALLHDPSTLKVHLRQRLYATSVAQHRDRWGPPTAPRAAAPVSAAPEPPAASAVRVAPATTTVPVPAESFTSAAATIPLPKARPSVAARRDSLTVTPVAAVPESPAPVAASATPTATMALAPSLWLSSAAAPIRLSKAGPTTAAGPLAERPTVTARADPSVVAPAAVAAPPVASAPVTTEPTPPAAVAAATAQKPPAATVVAADSPTVTAYARQARLRGVVPPAASVLRNLEYPSASSIPPVSIIAAEPTLPAEAAPSTAPVPRSRPH